MKLTTSSALQKLALLFLVFAGLIFAKEFLMPLAIGAVLATLFLPFCNRLEKMKLPRALASVICLLALISIIAAVTGLLGWQVSELTSDLTTLKERIIETINSFQKFLLQRFDISIEKQSQLFRSQQPLITETLQGMIGSVTSVFTYFILILVYVLFLLYYRSHLKLFILKLTAPSQKEETAKVIYKVAQVSQQYLVGLSKMIVCLWIMYGIAFSLLGVKNALFFAFLCGILEIVPFIGNITGTTITVLVSAVQGANSGMILGIIGSYATIQFIQGWVLEPLIVGSQVRINPLFTIIALIIGELVWGLTGIFLAIPIIAMIKIVCDYVEPLKAYGFLIGETTSGKKEPFFLRRFINRFKRN